MVWAFSSQVASRPAPEPFLNTWRLLISSRHESARWGFLARLICFRVPTSRARGTLSSTQWLWGMVAALLRRHRLSRLHAATDGRDPRRTAAILISSLFFTVVHLTKGWALAGMPPHHIRRRDSLVGLLVLVLRIARSLNYWPCHHGYLSFCLLVDRDRRRVRATTDRRDRRGPGFCHRVYRYMRRACDYLLAIWRLRSLRQAV
jgi:hypothetical protein